VQRHTIEQRLKRLDELDPSERNARRVQDVISLLEEYGGLAG
jgi:hypothetical protein